MGAMPELSTEIPAPAPSYEDYFINMGPQHPSTHGVLRMIVKLSGETVLGVTPHLGFVHRGIEKMAEAQTPVQFTHLTDRLDYLCSTSPASSAPNCAARDELRLR